MADKLPEVPGGPHLRTIAMPRDANAGGDIFGGWTLSQMDLAGGGLAAEQAQAGSPPWRSRPCASSGPSRWETR